MQDIRPNRFNKIHIEPPAPEAYPYGTSTHSVYPPSPKALSLGSASSRSTPPQLVASSPRSRMSSRRTRRLPLGRLFWLFVAVGLAGIGWLSVGWGKQLVTDGQSGYAALEQAARLLRAHDFPGAQRALVTARTHFNQNSFLLWGLGEIKPVLQVLPGTQRVVSGIALLQAGGHLTASAQALMTILDEAAQELRLHPQTVSLLDLLTQHQPDLTTASLETKQAAQLLADVSPESLPGDKRAAFGRIAQWLPPVSEAFSLTLSHLDLLEELLGKNGPRTYLFLFENNHELRPTGGFIGSYAILDINQGKVRRFFVDGIFNPDGQLRESIIPPLPIQKISAGWSLHDSNWFPDFPTSAEKARFFYEKTGGPTTDGVVALTPEVLERVLAIVGPIAMPEYGLTIDAENFLPLIQEEVELKYNKDENNPKKVLGDLTGVLLERLTAHPDVSTFFRLADALVALLNERHILLFAHDERVQSLIEASGWSGKVLDAQSDYLSVIHTNINGYKTDGVVDNTIKHLASIQTDGSIIDTVTITRVHRGGNTPYEWWNKVNADYMRVYVPLGSQLLSAEGMTREFPEPPVDYAALGFYSDPDVVREEQAMSIDESTGTRVGVEFGKTVFGNWVYVSPGESVTVTYRYRLPFHLPLHAPASPAIPFSILYQKQSGTSHWKLESEMEYPEGWKTIWQSPENLVPYDRKLSLSADLNHDVFAGVVFDSNP